jgi:hypothetical protein
MKRDELIESLKIIGSDKNTLTFAENCFDIGYRQALNELKSDYDQHRNELFATTALSILGRIDHNTDDDERIKALRALLCKLGNIGELQ